MATTTTKKRSPGRPKGSTNKAAPKAPRAPRAVVAAGPSLSALGEAAIVTAMTGAMDSLKSSSEPKGIIRSLTLVPAGTRIVVEDGEKSETYHVIALGLTDTGSITPLVHDPETKCLLPVPSDGSVPIKTWLNPGE